MSFWLEACHCCYNAYVQLLVIMKITIIYSLSFMSVC